MTRGGGLLGDVKPDGEKPRLRWWMLAVLLTVMTVGALGRYAFSPLGLMIMEDLKIGKGAFGALSSSIAVGAALTTLWAGLLIDRLGVRRMAFVGNLVMGVFLLGFFLPQTFLTAGLILFLAGLGFSVVTPATNSGIVDWFPRSERAFSLGLKQAGVPLGTALTAAAMPFLALRLGWRAALGCLGAVLVAAAFLTYAFYRDGPFAGEAAAAGGSGERGTVSRLLRDPNMVYLCLLGLSFCVLQMAVVTFLVPYLQEFFGMSVVEAGAYLGLSQVAGSASRPLVGLVSDRLFGGRRKETLCGVAGLAVAASVLFAFSPPAAPRWALTLIVVLVGAATLGWV
ncbi:MAG: MFS transporter, partial [Clostridia bacterium]|nr:MFS transporter [Clostridia bacterium]